jgi:hypothetical protein
MRHDPICTSWLIRCSGEAEAQRLQCWLLHRLDPDTLFESVRRAWPNELEAKQVEAHRLGDYFASVRLQPGLPESSATFRLLFQRRADAGRFWKDLMVQILRSLRETSAEATTTLDYKGDEEKAPLGLRVS